MYLVTITATTIIMIITMIIITDKTNPNNNTREGWGGVHLMEIFPPNNL
jgi:hypothetical protein